MVVNEILNIDCKIGFQAIPDESIDLCVTDPPYKTISGGKPNRSKGAPSGMLSKNDGKIFEHNDIEFSDWIPDVYRVLKDRSHCYIFTNLINLWELKEEAIKAGFQIHNLLIWDKGNVTPNKWYMKNVEYVLFLYKGKAKFINNCGSKVLHSYKNIRNKQHPTQKPIELLQMYIENSSKENDIVLDPFMGVASTAIASRRSNRKFVGFEIDKVYYDIGNNLIKNNEIVKEEPN